MLSFLKNLDLANVSLLGLKKIRKGVIEILASLFAKEREYGEYGLLLN